MILSTNYKAVHANKLASDVCCGKVKKAGNSSWPLVGLLPKWDMHKWASVKSNIIFILKNLLKNWIKMKPKYNCNTTMSSYVFIWNHTKTVQNFKSNTEKKTF